MAVAQHQLANGQNGITPKRIEDDADAENERWHSTVSATVSETTFHADDFAGASDPLPECERFATKEDKMNRLFGLNSGLSSDGNSNTGKVDWNAKDKRGIVETYASNIGLSRRHIEEASDLAARLDARAFSTWGGREALAIAVVNHVAPFDVYQHGGVWFRQEIHARLSGSRASSDPEPEAIGTLERATAKVAEVSA